MPNSKSRGARRRRNRRSRSRAVVAGDLADAPRPIPEYPTSPPAAADPERRLSANELDPADDLADTHGAKGRARTARADKFNSDYAGQGRVEITVQIPRRFHLWLVEYAALHNKEIDEVVDFALRQIWRDDPHRQLNQTASMPKERFAELFPDAVG